MNAARTWRVAMIPRARSTIFEVEDGRRLAKWSNASKLIPRSSTTYVPEETLAMVWGDQDWDPGQGQGKGRDLSRTRVPLCRDRPCGGAMVRFGLGSIYVSLIEDLGLPKKRVAVVN